MSFLSGNNGDIDSDEQQQQQLLSGVFGDGSNSLRGASQMIDPVDLVGTGPSAAVSSLTPSVLAGDGGYSAYDDAVELSAAEHREQVRQQERQGAVVKRLFSRRRTKFIRNVQMALIGLACINMALMNWGTPHSFYGSGITTALAMESVAAGVLAIVALSQLQRVSHDPVQAMHMLSWYCNAAMLLLVAFFISTFGVLGMSSMFVEYVRSHWTEEAAIACSCTVEDAVSRTQFIVLAVGLVSLVSLVCLGVSVMSISRVRKSLVLDEQAFLWVDLALGSTGSCIVGLALYAMYHEESVPLALSEAYSLFLNGAMLFGLSLFGIARLALWTPAVAAKRHLVHISLLVLCTLVVFLHAVVFLTRCWQMESYLQSDSIFARYGLYATTGTDDVRKLSVSARIQLVLLALACLGATLYGAVGTVFSHYLAQIRFILEHPATKIGGLSAIDQGDDLL
jgi:hypothetical protein